MMLILHNLLMPRHNVEMHARMISYTGGEFGNAA